MPLNDFHIQIATAGINLKKEPSRRGRTFRGDISTDDGVKQAYVKLLSIEDIAKEALCNVLARKLFLPIQPAYFVDMNSSGLSNPKAGNPYGVAFGMLDDRMPLFPIISLPETELNKWPDLLRCAVFDEWIANGDRFPNNMKYEKTGVLWLYDHDDALKGHVRVSTPISPQLLTFVTKGKSEHELFRIREAALKIVEDFKKIDWKQIEDCLKMGQLDGGKVHFSRYIDFLRNRLPEMREIITHDLGIRQKELFLTSKKDKSSRNTKQ